MSPSSSLPSGHAISAFFDEVIATSGLAGLIAAAAVTRACQRAHVDPSHLDPGSLGQVLPFLEMTLRLYLPDEADGRLRALRSLAR
jgi:glycerol uptake facilitator-like aquaporin